MGVARRYYNIAGLIVTIDDLAGLMPPTSFAPFERDMPPDARADMTITPHAFGADNPPVPAEDAMELISEDLVNRLYLWDNYLVKRTAMQEGDPRCMWTLMPCDDYSRADVYIPRDWLDYPNYGNAFMFEKMLLSHGAVMLHCSLIEAGSRPDTRGIAFTAPSQTGKSTQASLWLKHRDARIINGDRAILRAHPDGVYAYGSPWAGSSEIYENTRVKLSALVALAQAPDNTARALTHTEGLQYILAGTSLPLWDDRLFDLGMATFERILVETPLVLLSCTPDVRAVETLEDYLKWR